MAYKPKCSFSDFQKNGLHFKNMQPVFIISMRHRSSFQEFPIVRNEYSAFVES